MEYIEEVKMIMLNRANRVIGVAHLTKGGLYGCMIDTRVILQYASETDERITRSVKEALKLVEIQLLDHIIINKDEEFATIDV